MITEKEKTMDQLRQGDVFMERVSRRPAGCKPVTTDGGRVVLAYGEVTGHAHRLSPEDAQLYEHPKTKERYLRIVRETDLLHEEHAPIRHAPGTYRVKRQKEYTPEEIRNVAD